MWSQLRPTTCMVAGGITYHATSEMIRSGKLIFRCCTWRLAFWIPSRGYRAESCNGNNGIPDSRYPDYLFRYTTDEDIQVRCRYLQVEYYRNIYSHPKVGTLPISCSLSSSSSSAYNPEIVLISANRVLVFPSVVLWAILEILAAFSTQPKVVG